MIHAIPNPTKTIQFSRSIENVSFACQKLHILYPKYQLWKSNEVANQYVYETMEFLSAGVFMDISLSAQNSNSTQAQIEIRRKIGTFNQAHEVTYANEHIQRIISLISDALDKDETYFLNYQNKQIQQKENLHKKERRTAAYVFIAGVIIFALLYLLYK